MTDGFKYFSVMLVDDNEIDNIINSKMIEASGLAEVTYTHNSASGAIDFLKNIVKLPNTDAEKNVLPAFIFLDIDMPMMDGFQFLDEFEKLDSNLQKSTKIIMLSASINPRDKERAETYKNFVKFINKPLRESELIQL